ncbi:MAG: SIMPL domain-containing protein [Actinomycetota bacterium]|nr:SIMPL domain-containing protein [Actinomycetota bacterium]
MALLAAAPAVAAQTSTVTATGTAQAKVLPKNRHSNASIQTAYDAAQAASITGAVKDAHEYALDYAQQGGLTLGALVSVSDQQSNGFYGPGFGGFGGPFGPGQFCGTVQQPIFKRVNGRHKVVGFKKVHRCIVPPFAYTTLSLTYSAS